MSVDNYSGVGGLEEDGVGWEGWMAPREQASCPRPEEPPRVWCGVVTGWDWRRDCHRGNSLLRKQGACLEVNGQGQLRDGRDSGWCRDSRGGDRWMTLGCILKVNLIGLPEELLREVGARWAAVHWVTKSQSLQWLSRHACGGEGQREVKGCSRFLVWVTMWVSVWGWEGWDKMDLEGKKLRILFGICLDY